MSELTFYRGDSFPIVVTITDSRTSEPIDLDGYELKLSVSSTINPVDDSSLVFDVQGVIDNDTETGKVTFTPTSQNNGVAGSYYYDIQMIDSNSNIRTIVKAPYLIVQDITK